MALGSGDEFTLLGNENIHRGIPARADQHQLDAARTLELSAGLDSASMTPIAFEGYNRVFARNQAQYRQLPGHVTLDGLATFCWTMTWR